MRTRSRAACIAAAVAAVSFGFHVRADDLTWDYNPAGDGVADDGNGVWNTSDLTWVTGGSNVAWDNTNTLENPADSAIFGGPTATGTPEVVPEFPYVVELGTNVTVQNITFGDVANNANYSIFSFGPSVTLLGNVTKDSNDGDVNFFANVNLSAGEHVYALRDTGGPITEFIQNGVVSGAGGVTLDNGAGYEVWGTLGFNDNNTYTGDTLVKKGRLVITRSNALGATSAGTTISDAGTLSIGGGGMDASSPLTIAEPITITRNTYTGGPVGEPQMYERYPAALVVDNDGSVQTHTLSAPQLVVDSTDARIAVLTNTLEISSDIVEGTTVTPGTGLLTLTGDFAGFVKLTGNNTGIGAAGGIRLTGGVQLDVTTANNLGGASAPLRFEGSATLHPVNNNTWMPDFGSHVINNATFSGGINVDANNTFTVNQPLGEVGVTGGGTIGKRGDGTLNLNSVIDFDSGSTFWDAGVVNVNAAVKLGQLHLRSPIVNIPAGGSITTVENDTVLGESSDGTNGGPDKAVVNINGGTFTQQATGNFYVSNAPGTEGTINLNSGALVTNGLMHVGHDFGAGGTGTINQTGGTFTLNRGTTGNPDFTLVLGSRRGTGIYNLSGGTMTSAGEFYVGQGLGAGNEAEFGTGVFTMTGGTVNQNHWFVVGREGGKGTVDISGGTFNKAGNGNMPIGESRQDNLMTLRGNAQFIATTGEFWVANNGGNKATLNVQENAVLSLNDWFVVGRFDAEGTLNQSGGTITKNGGGHTEFDVGGGPSSTVTVSGNAVMNINSGELRVAQGGGANATLALQDNAAINTNFWTVIGRHGGNGTLNMSGGTFTKTGGGNFILAAGGGSNATLTQTGGTLNNSGSEFWVNEGGNSGVWNFSGGTANLGRLDVGRNGGGTAAVNLSGTATLNAGIVRFGEADSVSGTVNLDGGTLSATQVVDGNGGGAQTLNLNGGVLRATASDANWMTGPITANVKAGGAKLDAPTGVSATVNTPLVHDAALGATPDGGLTKTGAGTFALAAANTYTGGTTVNAGTLVVGHGDALAGGDLTVNDAAAQAQPGLPKAVSVNTLSFTGSGKLDLTDNDLVIKSGTLAGVTAQIVAGYNNGTWDGAGISSSSAATDPNADTALGFFDNAEVQLTSFSGVPLTGPEIVVKYTYYGDADLTGVVDTDDFQLFLAGYQDSTLPRTWFYGDFDYTGVIDTDDFQVFLYGYQNQGGPLSALSDAVADADGISSADRAFMQAAIAAVPEPASVGVLAVAGAGLLGAHRRRRRD